VNFVVYLFMHEETVCTGLVQGGDVPTHICPELRDLHTRAHSTAMKGTFLPSSILTFFMVPAASFVNI
jgi:hypothetical protein